MHTAPRAWAYVGAQFNAGCSWVRATPSKRQCCGHTRGCSHAPTWFLPTAKVGVDLTPHKGWQDCLLAYANLPHKLFTPQRFLKVWLCGYECYGGLHLHALFIWFWQRVGIISQLTFFACNFLASYSPSFFARAFVIIWSQVRDPARPFCSRAVALGLRSWRYLHFQQLVASSCVATLWNMPHKGFFFVILPSISLFSPPLILPESSKSFGKIQN